MDDKQQAEGSAGAADNHYQPWLRNGGGAGSADATRPAPLPTQAKVTIERADDPAPPMRPALLSADELLARPIPMSQPAPGTLGLIDRVSQGIADGTAAVRDGWRRGGIGDAVARLELTRRTSDGGQALGRASRKLWSVTAAAAQATGEAAGPMLRRASSATGRGLRQAGGTLANGARKLGTAVRDATGAAGDAIAARTAKVGERPESQLDRLMDDQAHVGSITQATDTGALPLFAAPGEGTAPSPRSKRKAAATDMTVEPALPTPVTPVVAMAGGDDRPPLPPSSGARHGADIGSGGGGRADHPWLRHPATMALGGALLLSTGFAAGLYWTGPGVDRATTERVVHDYLLNNPEILPQAMQRLQANQAAASVARLRSRIEAPFSGAWAGAADGDVTLTVFTDYACTFCRASVPDIDRLLREDTRLKVVFRELPILSQESEPAARLALAAARRGRYMPMHRALFESGSPDAAARTAAAERLGVAAGSAVLDEAGITRELQSNLELARELGFDGTPSWVIGDRLLTGAVGYEQLRDAIAEARAG